MFTKETSSFLLLVVNDFKGMKRFVPSEERLREASSKEYMSFTIESWKLSDGYEKQYRIKWKVI